jgi:hypothetical protein
VPSWALNNITAPDAYTDAATLRNLPFPARVNIDVANGGIYWQVQRTTGTALYSEGAWDSEVFMLPGSRSLIRSGIRGFRVRAAIPAASLPAGQLAAQVTVEASL